jgi:hypothetical protein
MTAATTGNEGTKAHRRRRTYIRMRLPLLRDEMKKLTLERKEAKEKLKGKKAGDDASPELKKLQQKQIYLAIRAKELKAERQALNQERKAFPEKPGKGAKRKKGEAASE